MTTLTLNQVRTLIESKKSVRWEAGETSVSHVSRTSKPGMAYFGIGASEEQLAETAGPTFEMTAVAKVPALPKALDWRNKSGANYVTSVKNQLDCGSCVAFATCASLEARDSVGRQSPNPGLDLAEAHLFFCGCGLCCGSGWQPAAAMAFAQSTGVGLEVDFPYLPHNQPCKSGITSHLKIRSHTTANPMTARKRAIGDGPVVAAMKVFRDFPYYKGGIYTPVSKDLLGLHAVCVIGYDTPGKYWIIKNSWGPGWGSGGFGRIAFGTSCEIDKQFPFWIPIL